MPDDSLLFHLLVEGLGATGAFLAAGTLAYLAYGAVMMRHGSWGDHGSERRADGTDGRPGETEDSLPDDAGDPTQAGPRDEGDD